LIQHKKVRGYKKHPLSGSEFRTPPPLVLNPILFAGGNGSDFDDGRTITVIAGLRGGVRTGAGVISSMFLVWGNTRA